jgi:dTDP-glucose 4,6-dehydratase
VIVNLDLLKFAGDSRNSKVIANYTFHKGNVCNRELVQSLFKKYNFFKVIYFVAKSHVYISIKNSDAEDVVIFNNKDLNIDWKFGADEI